MVFKDVNNKPGLRPTFRMVKHLPPSIKHLLALRNPHSYPSPPLSRLNEIFNKTYRDAQRKKAETGWLVLTVSLSTLPMVPVTNEMQTCTLLTANRPSAVGHLYRYVTQGLEDNGRFPADLHILSAVNKAALMRESVMKSVIFVGVPRVCDHRDLALVTPTEPYFRSSFPSLRSMRFSMVKLSRP